MTSSALLRAARCTPLNSTKNGGLLARSSTSRTASKVPKVEHLWTRDRPRPEVCRGIRRARRLALRDPSFGMDGILSGRARASRGARAEALLSIRRRQAPTSCSHLSTCTTDVTISRSGGSATRLRSIRTMSTGTIRAETFWCGRAEQGRPCRGSLRFDRGHPLTPNSLCWAYYFLCRYNEAVETADRALSRGPGSSVQMITHSFFAAAYGEMGRSGCRGRTRSSCFWVPCFEARTFAGQFRTQEAGDHLLEGLKRPGSLNTAVFALGRRN